MNEYVRRELNSFSITERVNAYREGWRGSFEKMIPKQILNYKVNGRRGGEEVGKMTGNDAEQALVRRRPRFHSFNLSIIDSAICGQEYKT